jgi:hydrogenase expression/formation protein HypC
MCLGIVGQIVALPESCSDLARVNVAGLTRNINIGILGDETLRPGDWLLIHSGFAMEKIDEETARSQMAVLADYTGGDGPEEAEFPGFGDNDDTEPDRSGQ